MHKISEAFPFFQDGAYVSLPAVSMIAQAPTLPQSKSSNFALLFPPEAVP